MANQQQQTNLLMQQQQQMNVAFLNITDWLTLVLAKFMAYRQNYDLVPPLPLGMNRVKELDYNLNLVSNVFVNV